MNLYLIWQTVNNGYDTYDSAVVVANSEDEARQKYPGRNSYFWRDNGWYYVNAKGENVRETFTYDWTTPDNVQVQYLGIADDSVDPEQPVISSFNAG